MQLTPTCYISGLPANKVCVDPSCDNPGFICRSCPNEQCQTLHTHKGKLTAVRWDETILRIRQLRAKKRASREVFGEIKRVGLELLKVVTTFVGGLNELEKDIGEDSVLTIAVERLEKREFQNITGKHFSIILESLSNPFLENPHLKISQFDEQICKLTHQLRTIEDEINPKEESFKIRHTISGKVQRIHEEKQVQSTMLEVAEKLEKEGKKEEAIKAYGEVIKEQPECAEAYHGRGRIYSEEGLNKEAILDYSQQIAIRPKSLSGYKSRSQIYKKLKLYPKAEEDLTKAIEIDPNSSELYLKRATIYSDQLKFQHAEQDYTKCIELNPNCAQAYYGRGALFYQTGFATRAVSDLTKAVALNPDYHQAFNLRGKFYLDEKQHDLALKDLDKAIELRRQPSYIRNRIDLKMTMGKMTEAQQDLLVLKKLNSSK